MVDQDEKKNTSPEQAPADAGETSTAGVASSDQGTAGTAARPLAGADVQAYIGRQLRAVYDDVARQPVPDRFVELMKQLETRTGGR